MSYKFADSLRAGTGWNWFGLVLGRTKPNQFHPDPARNPHGHDSKLSLAMKFLLFLITVTHVSLY